MRLSEHSKNRKASRLKFTPDLQEWSEVCRLSAYDTQIYKHFGIHHETFYAFLDREYYQEEQTGQKSAYVAAYKGERANTRKLISDAFLRNIQAGDTSAIIFGMKTFNGLIEARDVEHIELKKKEVELKSRVFLSNLANKFGLNFEELKDFAEKYYKDYNKIR